jgi:hypothetical protein
MTIPTRPLKLNIRLMDMKLKDAFLFDPTQPFSIVAMYKFLKEHSDWTEAELDEISIGDLPEITRMLAEELRAEAVPLAN